MDGMYKYPIGYIQRKRKTNIFNYAFELRVALYQRSHFVRPVLCRVTRKFQKKVWRIFLREDLWILYIYFGAISVKYYFEH
jgi:hypothetical protein